MADTINKLRFLEHGKEAPKNSRFKGIMNATSIIGWLDYTKREDANEVNKNMGAREDGYFGYTSTREGATKTFSSIGWLDKAKTKSFKKLIADSFNQDGNLFWDDVVSLRDYGAAQKSNLLDAEDYAAVVTKVLPSYFQKVGLNPENMVWWMNYHTNKDNPHIHISFLEKQQTRTKGKFTNKQLDYLKGQFVKEMGLREKFKEEIGVDSQRYFKMKDADKTEIIRTIRDLDFDANNLDLKSFFKKLPKTGRLQYNSSHMAPFKKELDAIIEDVLLSPTVKPKYENWLEKVESLAMIGNQAAAQDIFNIKETEIKKLFTNIGNSILENSKASMLVQGTNIEEDIEKSKHIITINKKLVLSETNDEIITRIPFTKMTFKLTRSESKWLSSNTLEATLSNKSIYDIHENPNLFNELKENNQKINQGNIIDKLNGKDLSSYYSEVVKRNTNFSNKRESNEIKNPSLSEKTIGNFKANFECNQIVEMTAAKSLFVGITPNTYIVRIPGSVKDVFSVSKEFVHWNKQKTSAKLFLNGGDAIPIYYDKNVFSKHEMKIYSSDDNFDGILKNESTPAISFYKNFSEPAIYDTSARLNKDTLDYILNGDYDGNKKEARGRNVINKRQWISMRDVGRCAMEYISKHQNEMDKDIDIFLNSNKEKGDN